MDLNKNLYLPKKRIEQLLLGASAINLKDDFKNLSIEPCFLTENKSLGKLSGHLDLNIMPFSDKIFTSESSFEFTNKYFKTVEIDDVILSENYPYNCAFNNFIISNYLICNKKCISKKILKYAEENDLEIICVPQGYVKCSVLAVNETAVITDDIGIYQALKHINIDTLLIQKGDIFLEGFEYGFIGGSAGLISKNEMLFIGNIKKHRNYFDIKNFLYNYNIDIVSLNNNKITDIGSFLPIWED